ncbi:MAG: efflux RND transporter periplasmic adaptor subunit [Verrucomicrobiia bacterium]
MNTVRFNFGRLAAFNLVALWSLLAVQHAAAASVIGITEPILDSTLGTPVAGIIAARKFKEGDFAKGGDVLIELDKTLEALEVARREVIIEPLRTDYEASKYLFDQPNSSMSKELLDKKHAEYKLALAEYELAKEQVRKRSIVAPFDGYVAEIFRQVGEAAELEQPILRLVDTRRCYFICNVEARVGHTLRPSQTVALEIESGHSMAKVKGQISFVSPVADPASGLMKVKVVFDNSEGQIRPGVAGRIVLEEVPHVEARN